jgi:predicted nucleic acid-binding Zn ribbon protein
MSSNNEIMNNERGNRPPLFRKMNYILMGVGALLLLIGYICLSGGDVPDEVFDGEIFNARRIRVAPILIFLGLATEIVAIMWHPKAPKADNE